MSVKPSKLLNDPVNVELIKHLIADPRVTTSELARRVAMSAPAVKERVQRLEDAGVITGYNLALSPEALGYGITVFVRVRPMPGRISQIVELTREIPQVVECHRITGDDCFIIKAHLRSLDDLDGFLDRFLIHGQTTTSIAQSSPVPPRHLPLTSI